jgi:hypothetical protein
MRKNMAIGALLLAVALLVWSDLTIRTASDGWCAWWRAHVKVCSVDVDLAQDPDRIAVVSYTNVKPKVNR